MRAVDTPTGSFKVRHQPLLPTHEEAETPRIKPQRQWDCSCPWNLGQATVGQDRVSNSHGRGLEAGNGYGNECLMPERLFLPMTGKSFPDATPPNLCPVWVRAGVWDSPQEAEPRLPPSPDKLKNLFRLEPGCHILSRSQPWSEGMTKLGLKQHLMY